MYQSNSIAVDLFHNNSHIDYYFSGSLIDTKGWIISCWKTPETPFIYEEFNPPSSICIVGLGKLKVIVNNFAVVPWTHFGSVNCGLLLANDFHILIPENIGAITTVVVAAAAAQHQMAPISDVRFAGFT